MGRKIIDRRKMQDSARRTSAGLFFHVPLVTRDVGPTLLLDLGSSSVSFYSLESTLNDFGETSIKMHIAAECMSDFEQDYMAVNKVDLFAAEVIARFGLVEGPEKASVTIVAGATGSFCLRLTRDPDVRSACACFVRDVEARMSQRLQRNAYIDIFVPSPDLLAKLELSGAAWLKDVTGGRDGCFGDFAGTVSICSHSARLTLRAPSDNTSATRAVQAYCLELPGAIGPSQFSQILMQEGFPRGLCGLFLATDDPVCAAAEAAGIADRPVVASEAVAALARRAADNDVKLEHAEQLNLIVMQLKELLEWILESQGTKARVLFRRRWHTEDVASAGGAPLWALGLLASQIESEGLATAVTALMGALHK